MCHSEMSNEDPTCSRFLFRVEDVFAITGRGCVLVPGIPHSLSIPIKRGAPLELRCPDGTVIRTQLQEIEMINSTATRESTAISLSRDVKKTDIPIGTEVWLHAELSE
jgi:translation elongation factor EF-Tu-like GTPase